MKKRMQYYLASLESQGRVLYLAVDAKSSVPFFTSSKEHAEPYLHVDECVSDLADFCERRDIRLNALMSKTTIYRGIP